MMAGAMLLPSASEAIATTLGADMGLGRMAGGGIMQSSHTWLLRGAGGPASLFILGMLPAKMGDGTLYTDDELRNLTLIPVNKLARPNPKEKLPDDLRSYSDAFYADTRLLP